MQPVDSFERLIMALPWIALAYGYLISISIYWWIKDKSEMRWGANNPPEPVITVEPVMPHEITTITGLRIAGVSFAIFLFVQVVIQ